QVNTFSRIGLGALIGIWFAGPLWADPPDARKLTAQIDRQLEAGWNANGATPATMTNDAEFVRRVYLDLAGRIPRVYDVREFLDDSRPDKRQRLIDDLLDGRLDKDGVRGIPAGYINHFATIWRREWLPQTVTNPQFQFFGPQFELWLRRQLRDN